LAQKMEVPLATLLMQEAKNNQELKTAIEAIPTEIIDLINNPKKYTGKAEAKAIEVADWALSQLSV